MPTPNAWGRRKEPRGGPGARPFHQGGQPQSPQAKGPLLRRPIEVVREALQTAPPVTPQRPSFRATLDALSHAFADAVLLAVSRALVAELADVLDPGPAKAPPVARKARRAVQGARGSRRPRTAPPSGPEPTSPARRASRAPPELELLSPDTYPETMIVDPEALLRARPPAAVVEVGDVPGAPAEVALLDLPVRSERPRRASQRAPRPVVRAEESQVAQAPQRAPDPVPRAGEEVLRASGGGAVLRRRRPPPPSPPTGTEA